MIEVFVDSSVLIEGLKGNPEAVKILNYLADVGAVAIINDIVVSEFLFHYIRLKSGASPLTVKSSGKISEFIKEDEPLDFITQFHILPTDEETLLQAYNFMRKYNLLPNDAIILAACKVNNIERLATLDEDLIKAAREEGLGLL
ncbi:type II toxin-antitoxin system VapC family toxin [Thermococcus stetteri]|uniref:type II toxin-antitoxin system VapC family toxin n=1 Tax=Thermococcus stetteri TaxID=49900 RepID=UPI001AEACB51|nr:type II toxin-antitoxin system VapC family toxin [Thermococcus stetteri]MBP1911062.1 putative nucleic acid-binding protein [Thermococcus stetteri]